MAKNQTKLSAEETKAAHDQVIADAAAVEAAAEAGRVAKATKRIAEEGAARTEVEAALPKHGPDVEGQGERAHYCVTLGYPLYHPFQHKLVPQGAEAAIELDMDYWVKTQLDAGLIVAVAKPEA